MKSKTILLVEDEDEIRFVLKEALEMRGHQVHLASEGVGAIQRMLDHTNIDTIISDVRMPMFGGDYWLKFLSHFCRDKYRIILQSGVHPQSLPPEFMSLAKPYALDKLIEMVEQ